MSNSETESDDNHGCAIASGVVGGFLIGGWSGFGAGLVWCTFLQAVGIGLLSSVAWALIGAGVMGWLVPAKVKS